MNQYEIELRDKFAVLALNQYFHECEIDQYVPRLSSKELAVWVYDRADDMMIERDEPKEYIQDKIKILMELEKRDKELKE